MNYEMSAEVESGRVGEWDRGGSQVGGCGMEGIRCRERGGERKREREVKGFKSI